MAALAAQKYEGTPNGCYACNGSHLAHRCPRMKEEAAKLGAGEPPSSPQKQALVFNLHSVLGLTTLLPLWRLCFRGCRCVCCRQDGQQSAQAEGSLVESAAKSGPAFASPAEPKQANPSPALLSPKAAQQITAPGWVTSRTTGTKEPRSLVRP